MNSGHYEKINQTEVQEGLEIAFKFSHHPQDPLETDSITPAGLNNV